MGDLFRAKDDAAELGPRIESEFSCLDELSDAGDLSRLLDELQRAEVLECPPGLQIAVYPSALEEGDVALITVFSTRNPNAHVVAASEEMGRLAGREFWEGANSGALTAEIIDGAIGLANGAIAAVRDLEEGDAHRRVEAPARSPRCGAEG